MVGVAIIKLLVKRKKKQPEMWFRRNCAIAKEGAACESTDVPAGLLHFVLEEHGESTACAAVGGHTFLAKKSIN